MERRTQTALFAFNFDGSYGPTAAEYNGAICTFQICVNQTCTSRFPFIDNEKCPSNHNNHECSGNGVS